MTESTSADLCPGCFDAPAVHGPCPNCGFDRGEERPANALPIGTRLEGKFVIGRVLGHPGGFGITYLAYNRNLEATVAIKEYLPRELATRAPDRTTILPHSSADASGFSMGLAQFVAEARTLAKMDHPNIVRVRDFFEANGSAYLVMDYYHGMTLAEYLTRQPDGRMSEDKAIALMQPVLDGLRAVHAKGFLHRDVKPGNIYLAQTDAGGVRPILLDFGAARQAIGEHSRSISVVLTAGYAPFEQYHRKGKQGPWTDVYAAAAVLYRMLTGETPPEAVDRQHLDELLPATRFGVSTATSNALEQALALSAADRPQSVPDLRTLFRDGSPRISPAPPPGPRTSDRLENPKKQFQTGLLRWPSVRSVLRDIWTLRWLGARDSRLGLLLLLGPILFWALSAYGLLTLPSLLTEDAEVSDGEWLLFLLLGTTIFLSLGRTLFRRAFAEFKYIQYQGVSGGFALSLLLGYPLLMILLYLLSWLSSVAASLLFPAFLPFAIALLSVGAFEAELGHLVLISFFFLALGLALVPPLKPRWPNHASLIACALIFSFFGVFLAIDFVDSYLDTEDKYSFWQWTFLTGVPVWIAAGWYLTAAARLLRNYARRSDG